MASPIDGRGWKPSQVATAEQISTLSSLIASHEKYKNPPSADAVARWLTMLAPLIESAKPLPEINARVSALASVADFPAYCYTKENLIEFAKQCQFLPTLKALNDFFVPQVEQAECMAKRAAKQIEYYNQNKINETKTAAEVIAADTGADIQAKMAQEI